MGEERKAELEKLSEMVAKKFNYNARIIEETEKLKNQEQTPEVRRRKEEGGGRRGKGGEMEGGKRRKEEEGEERVKYNARITEETEKLKNQE
jgi:hypothetical protein